MKEALRTVVKSLWKSNQAGLRSRCVSGLLFAGLSRIMRVNDLDEIYHRVDVRAQDGKIVDRILGELDVTYDIVGQGKRGIPQSGPLVVVANHPFGAVEGLMLASILQSVRPDTKIMVNHLLGRIGLGELSNSVVLVDPFDRKESVRTNVRALREAMTWVGNGGVLGVFPAGEVSHIDLKKLKVRDRKWNDAVAGIIRRTRATVLPVYFDGCNSALFHLLGLVHPGLRTMMLTREMLNKRNRKYQVRIGNPIPFQRLSGLDTEVMTSYLRFRTYSLHYQKSAKLKMLKILPRVAAKKHSPLVAREPANLLMREIGELQPKQALIESGDFVVLHATAAQIPHTLHEIGRLRELTFREAREGTGRSIDIDGFDRHYQHLFLWNREKNEVVGAYRLGRTDIILANHGLKGMYTNTLFEYKPKFFEEVKPALEVGRSFVRPEYQKTYHPLMLLWKGIGAFVSTHVQYRYLFGAVSINNDYHRLSRQLIVAFLKKGHLTPDLSALVAGRNAVNLKRSKGAEKLSAASKHVYDLQDLSELISDIEADQKGIPILLKHYMKLGGQVLGFSIDNSFSKVLDALVLVDLARTDPRLLGRYMGTQGAHSFLDFHGAANASTTPVVQDCA